jgi:hypothetical protein
VVCVPIALLPRPRNGARETGGSVSLEAQTVEVVMLAQHISAEEAVRNILPSAQPVERE